MLSIFRGDTFGRVITPQNFSFEENDKIKVGVKRYVGQEKYDLFCEHTFAEPAVSYEFEFSATETAELTPDTYDFEIEITHGGAVETVFRNKLFVEGDVVI